MQLGFVLTGRRINSAKFRLTPVRSLKDIIGPGNFDNETEICESRKFCLFAAARETEIFLRDPDGMAASEIRLFSYRSVVDRKRTFPLTETLSLALSVVCEPREKGTSRETKKTSSFPSSMN